MSVKKIKTPVGDRLKNMKTNKLAGSPPKKPRVPKAKTTLVKKEASVVSLDNSMIIESSLVEQSYDKFAQDALRNKEKLDAIDLLFDFVAHDSGYGEHVVDAIPKGSKPGEENEVGWIQWYGRDDGKISEIGVDPEYRRKGLATALYLHASNISLEIGLKPPKHHDVRTEEGDLWAQAVGGDLPPLACGACGEPGHYENKCGL